MRNTLLIAGFLFMAGCATTEYVGETYPPTNHADLYFRTQDITRPYKVMGLAKTEAPDFMHFESIKDQLVRDAMAKGADAVLVEKMDEVVTSSSTSTNERSQENPRLAQTSDSKMKEAGETSNSSSTSTTTQTKARLITAELLKYK